MKELDDAIAALTVADTALRGGIVAATSATKPGDELNTTARLIQFERETGRLLKSLGDFKKQLEKPAPATPLVRPKPAAVEPSAPTA